MAVCLLLSGLKIPSSPAETVSSYHNAVIAANQTEAAVTPPAFHAGMRFLPETQSRQTFSPLSPITNTGSYFLSSLRGNARFCILRAVNSREIITVQCWPDKTSGFFHACLLDNWRGVLPRPIVAAALPDGSALPAPKVLTPAWAICYRR